MTRQSKFEARPEMGPSMGVLRFHQMSLPVEKTGEAVYKTLAQPAAHWNMIAKLDRFNLET